MTLFHSSSPVSRQFSWLIIVFLMELARKKCLLHCTAVIANEVDLADSDSVIYFMSRKLRPDAFNGIESGRLLVFLTTDRIISNHPFPYARFAGRLKLELQLSLTI